MSLLFYFYFLSLYLLFVSYIRWNVELLSCVRVVIWQNGIGWDVNISDITLFLLLISRMVLFGGMSADLAFAWMVISHFRWNVLLISFVFWLFFLHVIFGGKCLADSLYPPPPPPCCCAAVACRQWTVSTENGAVYDDSSCSAFTTYLDEDCTLGTEVVFCYFARMDVVWCVYIDSGFTTNTVENLFLKNVHRYSSTSVSFCSGGHFVPATCFLFFCLFM